LELEAVAAFLLAILDYVLTAGIATISYVLILVGPGLILALLMNGLTSFVRRQTCLVMGVPLYLLLFGWLGVVVHELSHALFCVLFGHEIVEIKFFNFDADGSCSGHVIDRYDGENLYQIIGTFFVGVAPIIVGSLVIYGAHRYLLGSETASSMQLATIHSGAFSSLEAFGELLRRIGVSAVSVFSSLFTGENFADWRFYVFLYIAFSVGSAITLSLADIRGAAKGFFTFVILVFLFNLSTIWLTGRFADSVLVAVSEIYGGFYGIISFTLIMNLIFAALLLPVWGLSRLQALGGR
jgi:hypothetical protein